MVNAKADKASVGQQAAGIEKHPEVIADVGACARLAKTYPCFLVLTAKVQGESPFKYPGGPRARAYAHVFRFIDQAALEAYKERELPKLRDEVHRHF